MNSYSNYSNSSTVEQDRQYLEEVLKSGTVDTAKKQFLTHIKQWGTALVNFLAPSSDPRIKTIISVNGKAWEVYDPVTQKTHLFATEDGIRTWLEQRYYLP